MKVSIVIPAYNEEKNIANAIEAALAQDHSDYEIILLNNVSTDRTAEIASRYPIKLVHEPIKGLLSARERGRLTASGDIIANMDADCLPDTDWLSKGVEHFSNLNVVAASGPYDFHDGHPIFRRFMLSSQGSIYYLMSKFLQSGLIKKGAVIIGGNNLIRADVLEKAGGYTTSLEFWGEDTNTAMKISKHGRVVFDPKFSIKTSARRFKAEGTVHLILKYFYHFFKQLLK